MEPMNKPFIALVAILSLLVPLLAFFPIFSNGFVNWDDAGNLLQNFAYRGLGWPQIRWAFTQPHVGEYRPLAWLLYSLQYSLWGLQPGPYHVVSFLWHSATTFLLVLCLLRILQRSQAELYSSHSKAIRWLTVLVALVYQVHPLRTEVVAWVSIQSYLPATFFALLAVFIYLGETAPPKKRLGLVFICFVISLLFKAIALPLPLVLLALDYFPLGKIRSRSEGKTYTIEKIPYFAVSLLFGLLAIWAKQLSGSFEITTRPGTLDRVFQAAYGLCIFPWRTLVPVGLRAIYSVPTEPLWTLPIFFIALFCSALVAAAAWRWRKDYPSLLVSCFAYAVLLLPNLGLVRTNFALTADRYGYFPLMALLPLCVYGVTQISRRQIWITGVALAVLLAPLAWLSSELSRSWYSSASLWQNVIAQGDPSAEARNNLGGFLLDQGDADAAYLLFTEALKLNPKYINAMDNLALYYMQRKNPQQASVHFSLALELDSANAKILGHYAVSLLEQGKSEAGAKALTEALRLAPSDPDLLSYKGVILAQQRRFAAAARAFALVLKFRPGDENARRDLAAAEKADRNQPKP